MMTSVSALPGMENNCEDNIRIIIKEIVLKELLHILR
jgi:hypothetical protein